MNEITIHGNVTAEPVLRYSGDGEATAILLFSVAVNRGYRNRATGNWVEQTAVFHNVAAFRTLAENAAQTLKKSMAVTVTGQLADASYLQGDSDRLIRRQRLEAADIAVSLRWATAEVTRQTRGGATDTVADTETADSEPVAV